MFLSGQDPAEVEKSFEGFEVNLSTVLLGFARGAIGGFILSVLIAANYEKRKTFKGLKNK